MKNLFFVQVACFVLYSCVNSNMQSSNSSIGSDTLNGQQFKFYPDGNVQVMSNYKDGLRNGSTLQYYENGQISRIENFVDGISNGDYFTFYENGDTLTVGYTKNGKKEGKWVTYSAIGFKLNEFVYSNGIIVSSILYNGAGDTLH